jgi:hypothetical protein
VRKNDYGGFNDYTKNISQDLFNPNLTNSTVFTPGSKQVSTPGRKLGAPRQSQNSIMSKNR